MIAAALVDDVLIAAIADVNTPTDVVVVAVALTDEASIGLGTRLDAYSSAFALAQEGGILAAAGLLLAVILAVVFVELGVLSPKIGREDIDFLVVFAASDLGVAALIREEND